MSIKKELLQSVIKHFLIMVGVCIIVSIGIYFLSFSPAVELHPDAYRDMIRSIVVVYILIFVMSTLTKYILNRYVVGGSEEKEKFKIKAYFDRITPYESIAITFTMLTIVNSIMMLTGLDAPKEGVFAYIHLMTRLGIISLIVSLISFKEIKERLKCFNLKKTTILDAVFGHKSDSFISISKIFTNSVILYCMSMIAFQGSFNSLGGSSFYASLLILAGIIALVRVMSSLARE